MDQDGNSAHSGLYDVDLNPEQDAGKSMAAFSTNQVEKEGTPDTDFPDTDFNMQSLYRNHYNDLVVSLRRIYGSGPPEPEDIAQQAFYNVIKTRSLDKITNFKAYLWRTARNLVFRTHRQKREFNLEEFENYGFFFATSIDEINPERVSVAKEQLMIVNRVLKNMPEKRRRAIVLHRFEHLTVSEVARILSISRSTANGHILRGTIEIHKALKRNGITNRE
ncbi:MAG: sigma-70 family RNA polymerase sigma factor [Pseudomonadota bacterium]